MFLTATGILHQELNLSLQIVGGRRRREPEYLNQENLATDASVVLELDLTENPEAQFSFFKVKLIK